MRNFDFVSVNHYSAFCVFVDFCSPECLVFMMKRIRGTDAGAFPATQGDETSCKLNKIFYWLQNHTNGKFLQMYFRKFVHFLFILVISALPFSRDCKYFISFNLQNCDSIDNRFSILSFNFLIRKMCAYPKFHMKILG